MAQTKVKKGKQRFRLSRPYTWALSAVSVLLAYSVILSLYIWFQPSRTTTSFPSSSTPQQLSNNLPDNTLYIKKLKIQAPIIWSVDGFNKREYFKALEDGVAHFKGTPLPGQKGNCVIFGHSSFYKNAKGNYKFVFKELNRLNAGDKIKITYNKQLFVYTVKEKKIIAPTDFSIFAPSAKEKVALLTCWPPDLLDSG